MPSMLVKLLASKSQLTARSAVLFTPNVAAYSRFFNSSSTSAYAYKDKCNLKIRGYNKSEVGCIVDSAVRPYLSATNNLTRVLNLLDKGTSVLYEHKKCLRWNVMQDAKALHLVRNISGLPKKDVDEFHQGSGLVEAAFGCVRVMYNIYMIRIIVGSKGPDPGASYMGYSFTINMDSNELYKIWDTEMDVRNEVLKISIPKEEGKWIHTISTDLNVYDT